MANRTPVSPASQFLAGLAWTLLIVAAWACLRLGLWLFTAGTGSTPDAAVFFGITPPLSYAVVISHFCFAAFTVYAATALLKRAAWTQWYFVGLLLLIAMEAVIFGLSLIFYTPDTAGPATEMQGIRIAAAAAVMLIGGTAVLVAVKLLRDKRIRTAFTREKK
jgi:hypothetical protein